MVRGSAGLRLDARQPATMVEAQASAAEVSMATQAFAESLAALRAQRLAALLAAATEHSPRYRHLLAGCDPATVRLENLPVSRKAELMRDFEGWVTDPALSLQTLRRFVADPTNIAADSLVGCMLVIAAWPMLSAYASAFARD